MKLTTVKICNFRSFCGEETIDLEDLTAIIGANSSGKTALLQALLKLFGETSREREILRSDFHVPNNTAPSTLYENEFHIDVTIEFPNVSAVPEFFDRYKIEENGKAPYIRIRKEAKWRKSNQPEGIIESKVYCVTTGHTTTRINVPEYHVPKGDKKEISEDYLSLIKMIYIPALRNPNEQLKMISGTLLWRFINIIKFKEKFKNDINHQIGTINEIIDKQEGISKLKKIIRTEWNSYHNESKYLNVDLNINSNNIEDILKKIEVTFSPTEVLKNYTVDALGDGLRSMFYFALVGSLLQIEQANLQEISDEPLEFDKDRTFNNKPPLLTLVAVEEPENHVAPHLLGKIMNNLKGISAGENAQVILSSHSESIIKKVDPVEIRHFRRPKEEGGTAINKICLPAKKADEYMYVKEAVKAYPEIYFSSLVILGEGDSEEVIIPKILEHWNLDMHEISIVPLGGRHVNHFWKLLKQLDVPFITLLDLDIERYGGGWGRIKYVIEQLNKNGVDEKVLFNLNPAQPLDKSKIKQMHNWDLNIKKTNRKALEKWIKLLEEKHKVFFSAPLDIDFLMIKAFKENYIKTLSNYEGPKIRINETTKKIAKLKKEEFLSEEYKNRIDHDVACTLKDKTKTGEHYSDPDKRLMIWYNYFFLNRGKPTTHILALNDLKENEFERKLPKVFNRMISAIQDIVIGRKEIE